MPIIDYKITDIERNAVSVQEQRPDTMDEDADISKGWFDVYPDLIRTNLDGLCDFLASSPSVYESSADAATADKGSITQYVPVGKMIALKMANGNTAASPTLTIDGVSHAISGMPTVAKLSGSDNQTYLLLRATSNTLSFVQYPNYICEYGVSGVWSYERFASGKSMAYGVPTIAITSSGAFGTGGLYAHNGTFTFPTGIFNTTPMGYGSVHPAVSSVYAAPSCYATSATAGGVQIIKTNATGANISDPMLFIGTWK